MLNWWLSVWCISSHGIGIRVLTFAVCVCCITQIFAEGVHLHIKLIFLIFYAVLARLELRGKPVLLSFFVVFCSLTFLLKVSASKRECRQILLFKKMEAHFVQVSINQTYVSLELQTRIEFVSASSQSETSNMP